MTSNTVSETIIGDDVSKENDCLCDLLVNFEEALSTSKFKNFDKTLKFTYKDNYAKDFLTANFSKLAPSRILADEDYPYKVLMHLDGDTN